MEVKSIIGVRLGSLTKRTTSTNPFENTNFKGKSFKGNALAFADVFNSIKPVEHKPNKIKMVSSAVVGAVSNFKSRVTQPIIDFANNVKTKFYAGIDGMKNFRDSVYEMGKDVYSKISDVFSFKKAEEIAQGPKILEMKHINKSATVEDLKMTWQHEIKLMEENAAKGGKAAA